MDKRTEKLLIAEREVYLKFAGYTAIDIMWWKEFEGLRDRVSAILPLLNHCVILGLDQSPEFYFCQNDSVPNHFGISESGKLQYSLGKGSWVALGYPEKGKLLDETFECILNFDTPEEHFPSHRAYYKSFVEKFEVFEREFYRWFDNSDLVKQIGALRQNEIKKNNREEYQRRDDFYGR
jgi:hypothetical protein